jgi:hypothetical protein
VRHRHDRDPDARERADLRREDPAGVDDDVGDDPAGLPSPLDVTRPSATPIAVTRAWVRIETPLLRAPAARASARPDGSSQPSVGRKTAPSTPSIDMSGKRRCASVGVTSSSGSPNVRAHAAWRVSSSMRSGVDARRRDPTSCQFTSTPVSAARRR